MPKPRGFLRRGIVPLPGNPYAVRLNTYRGQTSRPGSVRIAIRQFLLASPVVSPAAWNRPDRLVCTIDMTVKEVEMNKLLFALITSVFAASSVLAHGLGVPTGGAGTTGAAAPVPTTPVAPAVGGAAAQPAAPAQTIMFQGGGAPYVAVPAYPAIGGGPAAPGGAAAEVADEEGGAAAAKKTRRSLATKRTTRTAATIPTKGVAP